MYFKNMISLKQVLIIIFIPQKKNHSQYVTVPQGKKSLHAVTCKGREINMSSAVQTKREKEKKMIKNMLRHEINKINKCQDQPVYDQPKTKSRM